MKKSFIQHFKNSAGFTLIEIIVVIAILALLATLIVGNYLNSLKKSRDAKRKTDISNIASALELFYTDMNRYPLTSEFYSRSTLCDPENCTTIYMQKIPTDPLSRKPYAYVTDEYGSYYRLYSSLEVNSDNGNGASQDGYEGNCKPAPCKYGKSSPDTDLITLSNSNAAKINPSQSPNSSPGNTGNINPTQNFNYSLPVFTDGNAAVQQNLDSFELKFEGLSSNTYYPNYKYQDLFIYCPKDYGVRNIQCKNNDNLRQDVRYMGSGHSVRGIQNEYGGVCSFAADSPFNGTVSIVCDKQYFRLPAFSSATLATKEVNNLPNIFDLYNTSFDPGGAINTRTTTVNSQQQKISLICPAGYKATNITCNTHFINYTYPYYINLIHLEKLESVQVDSVRTASCLWKATGAIDQTHITTKCEKQ